MFASSPPFETKSQKCPKGQSLMELPITRANLYEAEVQFCSSKLPYDTRLMYARNPYMAAQSRRFHLSARNLPFERSNEQKLTSDLTVLFQYITKVVIPQYAAEIGQVAQTYYAQFLRFKEDVDAELVLNQNPNKRPHQKMIPAKERHIVVETNCPFLDDILSDKRLFVLADVLCFHVCWDKTLIQFGSEFDDEAMAYQHNARAMMEFCNFVWDQSGLRERHRKTEGYPCANIKFKVVRDVSYEESSSNLMLV